MGKKARGSSVYVRVRISSSSKNTEWLGRPVNNIGFLDVLGVVVLPKQNHATQYKNTPAIYAHYN